MASGVIRLHGTDNVVIALQDLPAGSTVEGGRALPGPVPRGHKIAVRAIAKGDQVVRYGQIIGQATDDIAAGAHVHSHNLGMGPHSSDYAIGSECRPLPRWSRAPSLATTAPTARSAPGITLAS